MKRTVLIIFITIISLTGLFFLFKEQNKLLNGNVAISKDDQYIAFTYKKNGESAIYIANSDGTNAKKVKTINMTTYDPFISFNPKNNSQLLVVEHGHDSGKISDTSILEIVNTDSNSVTVIPTPMILVGEAIFSPDGNKIYFSGDNSYSLWQIYKVYSMDVNGSDIKIINNAGFVNNLNVLSNSNTLFAHITEKAKIFNVPLDEAKNTKFNKAISLPIDKKGSAIIEDILFTPDYKSIIFTRGKYYELGNLTSGINLFKFDIDTEQTTQLTKYEFLSEDVEYPVLFNKQNKIFFKEVHDNWFPGNWLPFFRIGSISYQLMRINTDGSDLQEINISI